MQKCHFIQNILSCLISRMQEADCTILWRCTHIMISFTMCNRLILFFFFSPLLSLSLSFLPTSVSTHFISDKYGHVRINKFQLLFADSLLYLANQNEMKFSFCEKENKMRIRHTQRIPPPPPPYTRIIEFSVFLSDKHCFVVRLYHIFTLIHSASLSLSLARPRIRTPQFSLRLNTVGIYTCSAVRAVRVSDGRWIQWTGHSVCAFHLVWDERM